MAAIAPAFFASPARRVARALVGCVIERDGISGRIVETEAYEDDAASHYVTRAPSAGALMGATHGRVYVYAIYGMHLCLNVTADAAGPGAVLLRAIEPGAGIERMRARRSGVDDRDLARGPGRLARALGITKDMTGAEFLDLFRLSPPPRPARVVTAPRVGITRATALRWRFCEAGSRFVSDPRPG